MRLTLCFLALMGGALQRPGPASGISYTFGSFLNSVVNPRFNNLD